MVPGVSSRSIILNTTHRFVVSKLGTMRTRVLMLDSQEGSGGGKQGIETAAAADEDEEELFLGV
jgi:hypothetical protein